MRRAVPLGGLLMIACHGLQSFFQIGLQVPLRFDSVDNSEKILRIATFNVALSAQQPYGLKQRLYSKSDLQLQNIAAILQKVRPSIVLLNEFDFDESGESVDLLQSNYLQRSQHELEPISYSHVYVAPSNTGIPSGFDLDRDGRLDCPGDAFGFGHFPGQYAFVLLSQYELERENIRTFQKFLWRDLPGALLPDHPDRLGQGDWYSKDELAILRLSSKNHVDVPVWVHRHQLHLLLSHPTPPVFDGLENRNGRRNHDEIRLWSDYLSGGEHANYLIDDAGKSGGLHSEDLFVVLGDLNADPVDGDSYNQAISQLLEHKRIHPAVWLDKKVPRSKGGKFQEPRNPPHRGDPAEDTAAWGLRVDYVLPTRELEILRSGVFWPKPDETEAALLKPSSDHRLVWVDLKLP